MYKDKEKVLWCLLWDMLDIIGSVKIKYVRLGLLRWNFN
jgi:hypothetical protein